MRAVAKTLVLVAMALAVPAGSGAAVAPYGKNDAGGFRNVLPPGEKGVGNAADLAAFTLDGTYPEHWVDQQPLYDGLLYAAAEPSFGMADVRAHYKDATFGVRAGDVESEISPRPGVTIVRDSAYGVPHIYGETRADAMFGTGYAGAADRLFLMDILRHTGKAELSSFIGGSAGNRAMDRGQWQAAPYTDAELEAQAAMAPDVYGKRGERLLADLDAYIEGINAYVAEALINPALLPAEYAALGKLPEAWTRGDVIATASLIGGIFGKGGGRELASAETLHALVERFGRKRGRRAWRDFRFKDDPEAPTTVAGRFPYESTNPFAKRGLALPDRGSVEPAPVAPPLSRAERSASEPAEPYGDIGQALLGAIGSGPSHASHWELIPGTESATGRPVAVLGPQVGYYVPQVLMEMDVHGPGIDARGATFPGVNLYVLLGHGRDYAWSATTATSDNVDTFAEVLCEDDFHYRYKGDCLPMEALERDNSWVPNGVDMTPPGSETLTAYRTVHGIVYARGEVDGKQVAFVSSRSTYRHEADSALFFQRMNDPRFMRGGARAFHKAAKDMNFAFNWSYLDDTDIAYELTGWYPQRARGVSTDFPVLGTGRFDWRGYDPETNTAGLGAAAPAPPRRKPADAGLVEQQAGARLVGGRRPVGLWADLPGRVAHRPDPARDSRLTDAQPSRAGEAPGAGGDDGRARVRAAADHAPRAWPGPRRAPRGGGHAPRLAPLGRLPPRPRRVRLVRRRRGRDPDGRVVPAAARGRVQPGARRRGVRRRARHDRLRRSRTRLPCRTRLLRRLVRVRVEGPARPVRPAPARGVQPLLLRARLEGKVPAGAAEVAGRRARRHARRPVRVRRLRGRPPGELLGHEPTDGGVGDQPRAIRVPEPADLPADRLRGALAASTFEARRPPPSVALGVPRAPNATVASRGHGRVAPNANTSASRPDRNQAPIGSGLLERRVIAA